MPAQEHISVGKQRSNTPRDERSDMEYTIDRFHDGAFEVAQPAKGGHRAGLDALLLAASLRSESNGLVADLGAGCGTAGLAALNLNRELDLLSVELNSDMFNLLKLSLSRSANARFKGRTSVLQADVTLSGAERFDQRLEDNSVDHVIMNPPYNTSSYRPPANAIKHDAYVLGDGGLDAWFRTAAAILRVGGNFNLIYRSEEIGSVVACARGRFGGLKVIPIHSRASEAAKRMLVCGVRGSKAPLSILPGFVVHNEDGSFTEHADGILKGTRRLFD